MEYNYIKSIHIIFVVCWFAALFYIVRLFVYTTEAQLKEEPAKSILTEQLQIMQKKLWYIIGWPAMIGTFVFGFWMIFINLNLLTKPWMWLKLIEVLLLFFYHLHCEKIIRQQKKGVYSFTSFKLRLLNELPTIFLVSIVFLVVVKSVSGLLWGTLGLIALSAVLIIAIMLYRRKNKKGELEN